MKEKRRHLRFPITAIAEIVYAKNCKCITNTTNISKGGIGLYSKIPFTEGSQIRLDIRFMDTQKKEIVETLYGKILYCHKWHLVYILGVEFEHELNHEETPGLAGYVENCQSLYCLFCESVRDNPSLS